MFKKPTVLAHAVQKVLKTSLKNSAVSYNFMAPFMIALRQSNLRIRQPLTTAKYCILLDI